MTSYCFWISEDLHRFVRKLQHMSAKLILLLFLNNFGTILQVARLELFRNTNKNNFALKCCKFLANLCKSSRRLSCKSRIISNINVEPRILHLQFLTLKSNSKWFALFSHQPELSLQPQTYYWRARIRSLKLL